MRKRTTTVASYFGVSTAPDKQLIRIDANDAVLRLDILDIAPNNGTIALELIEAINPVFTAEYSREAANTGNWTVGRIVKGDESFARAMIVADDTGSDPTTIKLVNVQGRFRVGETIREVGVKTTDTPNTAAYATLDTMPVVNYSEGDTAGTIAATSTDAQATLDDLDSGDLSGSAWYWLKTTFAGGITSASYVVRLSA